MLAEGGDYAAAAARAFEKCIELAPDHANAFSNLGSTYGLQGDHAAAVAAYQAQVRIVPGHGGALHNMGSSHTAALGEHQAAAAASRAHLFQEPESILSRIRLAYSLTKLNQLEAAVGECRKAIALQPSSVWRFLREMPREWRASAQSGCSATASRNAAVACSCLPCSSSAIPSASQP